MSLTVLGNFLIEEVLKGVCLQKHHGHKTFEFCWSDLTNKEVWWSRKEVWWSSKQVWWSSKEVRWSSKEVRWSSKEV